MSTSHGLPLTSHEANDYLRKSENLEERMQRDENLRDLTSSVAQGLSELRALTSRDKVSENHR